MKKLIEFVIYLFCGAVLRLRYRITYKGLENINPSKLTKPGGVLFLPNHTSLLIDPIVVTRGIWFKYPIRPLVIEYMYYSPIIHSVMKFTNAIPVPDNEKSSNSLKRKKNERAIHAVIQGLHHKENFLIYPAGRIKDTHKEIIGGASAVHTILQQAPETNVVLVRSIGLWGSVFSKAFTERSPPLFPTLWKTFKSVLKNLIFFSPRREILVEFEPAPKDFPWNGSRIELNRYLENWYNRSTQPVDSSQDKYPGEKLYLVSQSFWKKEFPTPKSETPHTSEEKIDLSRIPQSTQDKILNFLSEITERDVNSIKPQMNLSKDLGLDSLDASELILYLQEEFELGHIPVKELTTVAKMMAIANRDVAYQIAEEEDRADLKQWNLSPTNETLAIAEGDTIIETFLNNCNKREKLPALADARSGVLNYKTTKLRTLILAEYIRKLPGEHIGILLPSSVAATITFFAVLLAGKIPVMINWTLGPKHLESVLSLSGLKAVLSSWSFVDRLNNVDLSPLEDSMIMLEDVRRELKITDKLKALFRSKMSVPTLLKTFNSGDKKKDDFAVILFTSGTENQPKGVPLSNDNILSVLRSLCSLNILQQKDSFLAFLPPFHSFGLTVCTCLGPLSGMKVAFYPDPTDGLNLAKNVEKWGSTILVGAPTFLRKLLKAATPKQLKTLRFIVTGAEKSPPELFDLAEQLGIKHTIYEGYGVTECSPVITSNYPGPIPPAGVGFPLPGIEVCIVHQDTHELLPQGKTGLILAHGPNVFSGYLNKDARSPFIMIQNKKWYNTGDLGHIDDQGRLHISGRLKRFIKVGGEMISLSSIEDTIVEIARKNQWPINHDSPTYAVSAKEVPGEKPQITVFSLYPLDIEVLNQELKKEGFSNLIKVSFVKQIDAMPLMGTGKIHYRDLEARYM